jgi:uncharacterized membrane protein
MSTRFGKILPLAILWIVTSTLASGQGTYTQIDYPGAVVTTCMGVNDRGQIAGWYQDSGDAYHGLLLQHGVFTVIDYPGARNTLLSRINNVGQIVGTTETLSFVYDLNSQVFSQVSFPGSLSTLVTSINDSGLIAGYFTDNAGFFSEGFELTGSTYLAFSPLKNSNVYIWGVTAKGELVGYSCCQHTYDFSFEHGKYQQIVIPNSLAIYGVSPNGTAFIGPGFLYRNDTLETLQFPGGGLTYPYGVNNAGTVVGLFLDSESNQRGFVWTP